MLFMENINDGGCGFHKFSYPTPVHTIMGVICGQLLAFQLNRPREKLSPILMGSSLLVMGYGMDL